MSLRKYNKKRKFNQSPEPKGKAQKSRTKNKLIFVVQKHKARNLHYDFRLELDGVLKSWAVPKGPSLNPHEKHLAIMVEDHPVKYAKFEGTIPKGNYGAGTVEIFDSGYYEPLNNHNNYTREIKKGLRAGHLTIILFGKILKGEFALIKSPHMGENAWLLIKKDDYFSSKSDITKSKNLPENKNTIPKEINTSALKTTKMPTHVKPMLASLTEQPFDSEDWVFEIKWDGYRAITFWDKHKVVIKSRNGIDFTQKFNAIAQEVKKIRNRVVLDGEIVVVDEHRHTHFEWLQNSKMSQGELLYYVFDILWYEGKDLTKLTLLQRREFLKTTLQKKSQILISDKIVASGKKFFSIASREKLEGIMAKRIDSTYQMGVRGNNWLKIKTHMRQEVVIGGFTAPRRSREQFGSLVVGVYKKNKLVYVGNVGTGFDNQQLSYLMEKFTPLIRNTSPFSTKVVAKESIQWVKPTLVCEVSFREWTSEGKMRQPVFEGLRVDKLSKNVIHEQSVKHKNIPKQLATNKFSTKLQLTHLDKVFFKKIDVTKGDLINYYSQVAPTMLRYLKNRPQSLLRQPDGVDGEAFFQKDVKTMPPSWVKTHKIFSSAHAGDVNYIVVNNTESLLYMVQLGCIEINPWSSRIGSLDKPDWLIIDLDPEGVSFKTVVTTALEVKKVCDELNIPTYPKTSGKTGIHIFIPLKAKYTYKQTKQFTQILASLVNKRIPKITSIERLPKKRPHKVYLDFLQNNRGQTLAAPYSVRPTLTATVSTPLHWSEVNLRLKPEMFDIKNTLQRIKREGDLWKPVMQKGINMKKVLQSIERVDESTR